MDVTPLRIKHDKVDGFIRVYDSTRHLDIQWYLELKNKMSFTTELDILSKVVLHALTVLHAFSHNYAKINFDSFGSVPLKKH